MRPKCTVKLSSRLVSALDTCAAAAAVSLDLNGLASFIDKALSALLHT